MADAERQRVAVGIRTTEGTTDVWPGDVVVWSAGCASVGGWFTPWAAVTRNCRLVVRRPSLTEAVTTNTVPAGTPAGIVSVTRPRRRVRRHAQAGERRVRQQRRVVVARRPDVADQVARALRQRDGLLYGSTYSYRLPFGMMK